MNKIKRNHKDSVHIFGIQQCVNSLERDLGLEHDVEEASVMEISSATANIEVRIRLNGGVEMYFVDYTEYPHFTEYEIQDWFVDSQLEWSGTDYWFDYTDYPSLVTPTFPQRLAGAIEICRLLLDAKFHDAWNFTVSTELKGGNEYSYMPLSEYIHPAYIRGV